MVVNQAFMVKTTNLIDWTDSSKMFTGASAVWGAGSVRFSQDPAEMFLFCHDIGTLVTGNQGKWFDWLGSGTTRLFHTGKLPHGSTLNADIHPTDADIIVATAGNLFDVRLVRTDDRGKTWSVVSPPGKQANSYFFVGIHQQNPQYVYAGDKRSTDGGLTFQNVDFGASYKRKNPFSILDMSRTNSDVVYAVDRNQRIILRSNDRAETWEHYGEPGWRLSHSGPRTLLVLHPNNHDLLFTQGPDGDLASFDGKDWKRSFGVLALAGGKQLNNQVHSLAIDPNNANVLYVSMYADGVVPVWGSTDGGATWKPLADNLPYFGGNQLTVNPHTSELLFTSNMGTWIKRPAHSSHPAAFWENAEPRPAF